MALSSVSVVTSSLLLNYYTAPEVPILPELEEPPPETPAPKPRSATLAAAPGIRSPHAGRDIGSAELSWRRSAASEQAATHAESSEV